VCITKKEAARRLAATAIILLFEYVKSSIIAAFVIDAVIIFKCIQRLFKCSTLFFGDNATMPPCAGGNEIDGAEQNRFPLFIEFSGGLLSDALIPIDANVAHCLTLLPFLLCLI